MLGRVTVVQDDKKAAFIQFTSPCKLRMGETVNVTKKRKARTLKQNALYWCFLSWCIHPFGGDLQSSGHFSIDALHEDIKAWFKATHRHDFNINGRFSTADLNKKKFKEFFDLVNLELMIDILGVDTSGFWKEYEKYGTWTNYNDEDFRTFMDEKQVIPF